MYLGKDFPSNSFLSLEGLKYEQKDPFKVLTYWKNLFYFYSVMAGSICLRIAPTIFGQAIKLRVRLVMLVSRFL